MEAGSEAVDSIIKELAPDRSHGRRVLAKLLAIIDDPKASPLLKKMLDDDEFNGFTTVESDIEAFVNRHSTEAQVAARAAAREEAERKRLDELRAQLTIWYNHSSKGTKRT